MARWSREDKTLHAKVVYYGPACGGKTANLDALHRIAAARRGHELLTVRSEKDSTTFFDLLPFELDDVQGCRVAFKLYTVPGPVRYDATRKVILNGADAIVFVADSSPGRREQNVWSLQNLRMNMRAKNVDPTHVPIVFQINKRDLAEAAPAAEVAEWLGVSDRQVIPAVATRGEGVLESFKSAAQTLVANAFEQASDPPRPGADADDVARSIDRALAPHAERLALGWPDEDRESPGRTPIVLSDGDLLEGAIETSVRLGEASSAETARARRLARQADGFHRLGESLCELGTGPDRIRPTENALTVARDVLGAAAVTLVAELPAGPVTQEAAVGWDEDPLHGFPSGRKLLRQLMTADGPCVVDDLSDHCDADEAGDVLERLRSVAAVPFDHEGHRVLLAYVARPDGFFEQDDVRFLRSVARHLAAGLDKSRAREDVEQHRDRLDRTVSPENRERRGRGSRRAVDQVRERFLSNLSSEMQIPLAGVLSAATALRDYHNDPEERSRLVGSIVGSAELLQRQLGDLSRLIHVTDDEPLRLIEAAPRRLVEEGIRLAGHEGVRTRVEKSPDTGRFNVPGVAQALANLIDNAVKFSPENEKVQVRLTSTRMAVDGHDVEAVAISVLDRGPGVPEEQCERIFAPFANVGETSRNNPQGLGIGLYEARCLARRHGGKLEYAPRKGGGSEFRLTVPLEPVACEAPMEVTRA